MSGPLGCPCDGRYLRTAFSYSAPPAGEVRFHFADGVAYRREVQQCALCAHFVSVHSLDMTRLYEGDYVSSNYADEEGVRRAFDRITSFPPERSDNAGRVARILDHARRHLRRAEAPTVLDVGSGLCVFLHRLKAAGWKGTALDPDPRAVRHAREVVGVDALCGDFMDRADLGRFDVVTFNKVLEHVRDPVAMLARTPRHLTPGGFVYVELPDGEAAAREGPGREEFFIDHWHVFSPASVVLLASRAGFSVVELERLREPSGKFTLRAFLAAPEGGQA
jgi:SAM-dependent methyltransferase